MSGECSEEDPFELFKNSLSFERMIYISSLQISVFAGTFIHFKMDNDDNNQQIGRIIDIALEYSGIPLSELCCVVQPTQDNRISLDQMYAKVNVFQKRSFLAADDFPPTRC